MALIHDGCEWCGDTGRIRDPWGVDQGPCPVLERQAEREADLVDTLREIGFTVIDEETLARLMPDRRD